MPDSKYVEHGKVLTDHLGPINATMFLSTGLLVPIMDFIRPRFPYINYVTAAVGFFFVVLFIMKLAKVPRNRVIPNSFVLTVFVCTCVFSISSIASAKYAAQGGYLAAASDDAKALQSNLLNLEKGNAEILGELKGLRSGTSSDPRVELKNIGISWTERDFIEASAHGDLRALELFLKGGMPVYLQVSDYKHSLAQYIVERNPPNAKEQLVLLKKYGMDFNSPKSIMERPDSKTPPNLYFYARDNKYEETAAIVAELGVSSAGYEEWKKTQPKPSTTHWSGI